MRIRFGRILAASALTALALPACIGVSQTPYAGDPATTAASGKLTRCPGFAVPAVDGLIDDFEDGNNQVMTMGERDGYWWVSKDALGTSVTAPEEGFKPADGGAAGSAMAAHVVGHVVAKGDQAWGVEIGGNFMGATGGLYDASRYAGISFKAKVGNPKSTRSLRVNVPDVNTHQDAGVCKACWNHFRKDFNLSGEWKEYRMMFTELEQRPGWGDPRPAHLTPSQTISVTFALGGVDSDFDIWIDDIQFLECKK
jgi:hypothetical protein